MTNISGKHALLKMLQKEGVNYMFGNPGTSEAPMMAIMNEYPSIEYVLVLQEGVAVGLAEGYGRASKKVPFVSLHIDNGMANGLSLMIDQLYSGTPMVMTAGNKDIRKMAAGRSDLADMARPFAKWSTEITHAEQVPSVIRRAFQEAKTPPTGPTFVSMSQNAFDDVADVNLIPSSDVHISTNIDDKTSEEICDMIMPSKKPILIVGDRISQTNAVDEAVKLAEIAGMRVYGHNSSEVNFPANHSLWQGNLNMRTIEAVKAVKNADVILAVGCPVFEDFFFQKGEFVSPNTKLIHIDINNNEIGKSEPTDIGIIASPKNAMKKLFENLESLMTGPYREASSFRAIEAKYESDTRKENHINLVNQEIKNGKAMSSAKMLDELAKALPEQSSVFNDGVSNSQLLFESMLPSIQGSYYGCRGQAIGWGIGATMGMKLGDPSKAAIGVIGDGSAIMTIQGLWTAANSKIPSIFVICNNSSYRVLKINMNHYHRLNNFDPPKSYFAMDFHHEINFAEQAKAYGINGVRIENPSDINSTLNKAIDSGEPTVIDMIIDGSI